MGLTTFLRFPHERQQPAVPSPLGLAWAQRLAESTTPPDAGAQESFARALAVGILAAGAVVYLLSAPALQLLAPPTGWTMLPGMLICLVGLWVTLNGGRRAMFWGLNCAVGFTVVNTFGITLMQGGLVSSGANPIWALVAPIIGGLVFGARDAFAWLAIFLVGMALVVTLPLLGVQLPSPGNDAPQGIMAFNLMMFSAFIVLCLIWFIQQRRIAEAQLREEQRRSEALLLNVLPEKVAERLKAGERVADKHIEASVLFADLVGFTPLSASLEPDAVLRLLDNLFREFDEIAEAHGVEKIKTIGDCYMAAAGVPNMRSDHAVILVRVALEMNKAVAQRDFGGHHVALRIGVHTGPLVAGVIGERRLLYDLWGDTVNVASRMESTGVPGRVHISEQTHAQLNGAFPVEARGKVQVKGKGELHTYFVSEPKHPNPTAPGEPAAQRA